MATKSDFGSDIRGEFREAYIGSELRGELREVANAKASVREGGLLGDPRMKTPPSLRPEIKSVSSGQSVQAYHSTLFRNFALRAEPTYNFYVNGETAAPTVDVSGSLSALPRYVTLRWHPAPANVQRFVGQKSVRTAMLPTKPRLQSMPLDIALSALANGYISPGVVSAVITDPPVATSKTPTKIDEDSFLTDPSVAGQFAAAHVGDINSRFSVTDLNLKQSASVVNFVDPSIAGAFDKSRLMVATDPVHLTVAGSLAKIIGALEVISEFNQDVKVQNPPPDFTGHPDAPAITYIGCIIERYDMLPDGSMVLGRSIQIPDVTADEFIDQQVAYGGNYSYRMRSIIQWNRTSDVDFGGKSTIDRLDKFGALTTSPLSSFYAGDWTDWSSTQVVDTVPPEPPDEVTVRPVSWKGEIRVSWKIGNDPQRDVTGFRLLRAVSNSGKVSDWKEIGQFALANGSFVDRDVQPFENSGLSYIYALYSTSYHGVLSPLSDQMEARLALPGSKDELHVIQIAPSGADPMAHASARETFEMTELKANQRLTFYCRSATSGHPLRDSTYLVEVRSLSTGERALVNLDVDATDIGVVDA